MADDLAALSDGLSALSQFFVADGTLGETLLRVAELACQATPADLAGITMLVDGRAATGVFTDPTAPQIDAAQYETGAGPCLDAFRDLKVYRIDSTAADDRWPAFARDAAAHDITATLSVPLVGHREGPGALNLYSRDARQLGENMRQAMQSRATIDQAIGILMADGGRTAEEGFQLLVRVSQRENRKLRDIAADIIGNAVRRPRIRERRP